MHFLNRVLLLVLLGGAVYTDLRSGRILNAWLIPLAVAGALLRVLEEGPSALPPILLPMFFIILFLFPFYRTGGLGAGDVKFLMAISVYLKQGELFPTLTAILVSSAVFSLICLLIRKEVSHRLPFALPIAAGVLLHLGGLL